MIVPLFLKFSVIQNIYLHSDVLGARSALYYLIVGDFCSSLLPSDPVYCVDTCGCSMDDFLAEGWKGWFDS